MGRRPSGKKCRIQGGCQLGSQLGTDVYPQEGNVKGGLSMNLSDGDTCSSHHARAKRGGEGVCTRIPVRAP